MDFFRKTKFYHFSSDKFTSFQEIKSYKELGFEFKPQKCLWLSCNDDWKKWVDENMEEGFMKNRYTHKYEFEVNMNELLILNTLKDIEEFTNKYGLTADDIEYSDKDDEEGSEQVKQLIELNAFIAWSKIPEETGKSGIFVKNAQIKKARNKYLWYSSFDICSIAIWNKKAIKDFKEVSL